MKINKKITLVAISAMLIISGCSSKASPNTGKEQPTTKVEQEQVEQVEDVLEPQIQLSETELQQLKPNEAGQVMVLMYHHIATEEAEWTRTPENFRKDLNTLYEKGYRPISLKDYAIGNITTQAGYTPVVLTFDDGNQNNFNMIQDSKGDWVIDPDSAVAILVDFNEKHPDFPLEATFFLNDNIPFGQKEHLEFKLKYIAEKGMDLGNHTLTHVDFTNTDSDRIQKEVAGIVSMLEKYIPDHEINTMALPFGSRPKNKDLYKYLEEGTFDNTDYKNIAILNVGWDPHKSPYHKDFNPLAIHRIRASELQKYVQGVGMYDWLEHFDKGSRTRYISDGQADTVTVPENYEEALDLSKTDRKSVV